MSRVRRIRALERTVGRPADVTWQEAYAAWDRIEARLVAKFRALAARTEPLVEDPVLVDADQDVLDRWRRQRGIPEPDPEDARQELLDRLRRIEQSLAQEGR